MASNTKRGTKAQGKGLSNSHKGRPVGGSSPNKGSHATYNAKKRNVGADYAKKR